MKKILAVLLFLTASAFAQSAFDGTWVANLETAQLSKKPHVYLLDKGMFVCAACVPKLNVKADGQDQKVTGSPYFNTYSVHVIDDHTVEDTVKQDGKVIGKTTRTVSADGNTLTDKFEDDSEAKPVTGEETYSRVSKGPAGSHALSGSWREAKILNVSSNGNSVTYQGTTDGLKMSDNNGESYDARFDGKDYPIDGDPGHTMVSLKKVNANTIEETDKRGAKIVGVSLNTVAANGKSMKIVYSDKERGTSNTFTLDKK